MTNYLSIPNKNETFSSTLIRILLLLGKQKKIFKKTCFQTRHPVSSFIRIQKLFLWMKNMNENDFFKYNNNNVIEKWAQRNKNYQLMYNKT